MLKMTASCRSWRYQIHFVPIRARFKRVEALGRIIIRGPYPPSNAIIYMHTIVIITRGKVLS